MRQTNGYGSRDGSPRSSRSVFIACEGYKTENNYFNELSRNRRALGIPPGIRLVVLNRFEDETGLSDPMNVAKLSMEFLEWVRDGRLSVHLYAGTVVNAAGVREGFGEIRRSVEDALNGRHPEWQGYVCDVDDASEVARGVLEARGYGDAILPPPEYDFREGDVMCIVVDRDRSKARPAEKYLEFLRYCREHGLGAYVTNPKFELWVLLHWRDAGEVLDGIVGSTNPSKAVDKALQARTEDAGKGMDFSRVVLDLDVAMENSRGLTEDLVEMESEVGTNLPALIRHMRST